MRQVRFKFRCNILITCKIIKKMPGSVASGTPCRTLYMISTVYFTCLLIHFNSNKSPTRCNNFPVYYPDVYLQPNMFRAFSHPPSGAQWLQWQPLVLPSYRGDSRAVFVVGPVTFSPPPSGAQWLQRQPLVLPSYRGDSRAVFVVEPVISRCSHWGWAGECL